jgi:hypothetical protein
VAQDPGSERESAIVAVPSTALTGPAGAGPALTPHERSPENRQRGELHHTGSILHRLRWAILLVSVLVAGSFGGCSCSCPQGGCNGGNDTKIEVPHDEKP